MGQIGMTELLIILGIIVLLFGGRRIPELMRGFGEGIRSFKEGMRDDSGAHASPPPQIQNAPPPQAPEKK